MNFFKNYRLKNGGYTLIEIVVVIFIMATLTVIIYSSFDASKAQSRDQKRVSDISAIQLALEHYFYKYGVYPVTLDTQGSVPFVPTFMSSVPKDPNGTSYNYFPITKTSQGSTNCVLYQLWARFEMGNQYLDSRRGFNSSAVTLPNNMFDCGGSHNSAKINPSLPGNSLVFDVMP